MRQRTDATAVTTERSLILRGLARLVVLGAALVGTLYCLGLLVESDGARFVQSGFDRPVLEFFEELRSSAMTSIMKAATRLGGTVVMMVLLVGAAVTSYLLTRNPRWPIFFVAVLAGAPQFSTLLKGLLDRPRPVLSPLYEITSAAFPSGHATAGAACFCAIGFFIAKRNERPRSTVVWICAIAVAFLVGVTRIYLGVHWPSDVLAGWLLGGLWVTAVAWAIRPGSQGDAGT